MWWKLAAGAGVLAFAAFLVTLYGRSRENAGRLDERIVWMKRDATETAQAAKDALAGQKRVTDAVTSFADAEAALKPIIVTNTKEIDSYAESPAGRVVCRDPERVREIDALDQTLFPAASAAGASVGAERVPAEAAATPAGR